LIPALGTLKEDYGSIEEYTGTVKVSLDEAFVKWGCKKEGDLDG
jgi:hypothetical protein